MDIQIITCGLVTAIKKPNICRSPISSPKALDDYDFNIIDLSSPNLWTENNRSVGNVDSSKDFITIEKMVEAKKKAIVIFVLPQNITYNYNARFNPCKSEKIKDILKEIKEFSFDLLAPSYKKWPNIEYENTRTVIGGHEYEADFYFKNPDKIITNSVKSEKPTTIEFQSKVYLTTLDITQNTDKIENFITNLFLGKSKEQAPEWLETIEFNDDNEQTEIIKESGKIIEQMNQNIKRAQEKLEENLKYKSILYASGNELVSVVFDILEKILCCDLSDFKDVKKEDFLINLEEDVLIGEIKGVTSNIKSEHVSQIDTHFYHYVDEHSGCDIEKIHQILIVNPLRKQCPSEREKVNNEQIQLAVRNKCLIIDTNTLLRLFEKLLEGKITTEKCREIFCNKTGLLKLEELFDND
ncbi:MAG: hypothetical protein IKL18_03710 [Oscillospiraceae bacterium]|nr:hypothetical protein [Oscillospiraceae bacterium]